MKKLCILLTVAIFFTACTHELRVTNENMFKPSQVASGDPVKVGFLPTDDKLLNSVIDEIRLSTSIKEVKKNCAVGSGVDADYIAGLSENMKFRASGQNFFITFPGFIIFAHSLVGYKYYVDIDTNSKILDPGGKILSEALITTPYEIRYTSFARGAATSLIGWFTPGFGALDIIPGAMFASSYDERATYQFIERVSPSYKAYVSSKILEQIAEVRKTGASVRVSLKMEPVVIGGPADEDVSSASDNRMFAVHVMKVEGNWMMPYYDIQREVPDKTLDLLDDINKRKLSVDSKSLRELLLALGVSDMHSLADIADVNIYSLRGDRMVTLFEGSGPFSESNLAVSY
ncbi:MAG TPA: hypothetical protein VK435_04505 [Thermodesulfovibrionales bacterium]|nr:hypothetical protein [Thermodesulfovibrionales bacterium]